MAQTAGAWEGLWGFAGPAKVQRGWLLEQCPLPCASTAIHPAPAAGSKDRGTGTAPGMGLSLSAAAVTAPVPVQQQVQAGSWNSE